MRSQLSATVIRIGLIALMTPLTMGLRCVPDFGGIPPR